MIKPAIISSLSDITVRISFVTGQTPAAVPEYDFELVYFVGQTAVSCGRRNGNLFNCECEEWVLTASFGCPRMSEGRIRYLHILRIPDTFAPGGVRTIAREGSIQVAFETPARHRTSVPAFADTVDLSTEGAEGVSILSNRSDISIIARFYDDDGVQVPVPEYDFELVYFVSPARYVSAGRVEGQYVNCRKDGDTLRILFQQPMLGCGVLRYRHIMPAATYEGRLNAIISADKDTDYPVTKDSVTITDKVLVTFALASEDQDYITTEDDELIIIDEI